MKKELIRITKPDRTRIKGRVSNRPREPIPLTLHIHDLAGPDYRAYPYRSSPGVFAIRTKSEIVPADVLHYEGVAYKAVSVEPLGPGCWEVRTVVWPRLQEGVE